MNKIFFTLIIMLYSVSSFARGGGGHGAFGEMFIWLIILLVSIKTIGYIIDGKDSKSNMETGMFFLPIILIVIVLCYMLLG